MMQRRMGHRSFKSIIVAETAKAWKDVVVQETPDECCAEEGKIGSIPNANGGGHTPPASVPHPGSVMFMDICSQSSQWKFDSFHFIPELFDGR